MMIEKNKLGMLLFLGSEAFFFAVLILTYVYYRGASEGPQAADSLEPAITAIFTVFLLGSSVTLWLAERSMARGNHAGLRLWLLITVVLGAIFLVGQAIEYIDLIERGITPDRNLFGTTFFTLTGFHGLHVFSGLVALTILLGLAQAGWFRGTHSAGIESVGLYWHFVDVVWVLIFGIIYLWPLMTG